MPRSKTAFDRRIIRTRESLRAAFMELVLEKGYDAITVSDIVDRANIARSTFYAHHGGKESVLLDGIRMLHEFLLDAQRCAQDTSRSPLAPLGFSLALFEHADAHRDLYHALMGDKGGTVMINAFRQMLARLVRRELTALLKPDTPAAPVPADAIVRFLTEALMGVITWWVDAKPKLSPGEGDRIFRSLVEPSLIANGCEFKSMAISHSPTPPS